MESPARTEAILRHLATTYGVDAVQFYDNNFFLREDHARELVERMTPLEYEMVVRGARRHHDALFGRDLGGHSTFRLRHDFLWGRIGLESKP